MTLRLDDQLAAAGPAAWCEPGDAFEHGARPAARRVSGRQAVPRDHSAATSISPCSEVIPALAQATVPSGDARNQSLPVLFEPGPRDEAVAIDCETTGLDPRRTTSSPSPPSGSAAIAS